MVELVIKLYEDTYKDIVENGFIYDEDNEVVTDAIKNGTLLPKGHGRIVDIGKIDEDRIDKDNPIISLSLNGEYIEAVSLDYLNNLSTIIEADEADSEE